MIRLKNLGPICIALSVSGALALVGAVTYERSVSARLDDLLDSGSLPQSVRRTPVAPEIVEDLEALMVEVEATVGDWSEPLVPKEYGTAGAPWRWALEHEEWLHETADQVEPILARVDSMLASRKVRRILADDGSYAGKPSRGTSLGKMRYWANLQCASALSKARREQYELAAIRLASALDLARLMNEQTAIGGIIQSVADNIALDAAARILQEQPSASICLQEELEGRLVSLSRDDWSMDAYWSDIVCSFRTIRKALRSPGPYSARFRSVVELDDLISALEQAREVEFVPWRLGAMAQSELRTMTLGACAANQETTGRSVQFVRVLSAVLAHREETHQWPANLGELSSQFEGELPVDFPTGERFRYIASSDSLCISLPASVTKLDRESESPLARGEYHWVRSK